VSWRGTRRNVRRFFEIDDLVALRSDREPVFRKTHAALLGWVERGLVDGLRVDHVDGLRDPQRYLELLRAAAPDCWIGVEKILARDEELPRAWPVDGTTGYEFLTAADELLVDPDGLRRLRALLAELTGDERPWEAVVRHCRGTVLARLFQAELERCTRAFEAALTDPPERDALRAALAAVLIELDVYRTYLRPGRAAPAPEDVARIESACARARQREAAPPEAVELLREVLLERDGDEAQRELVELFQTLSPALTAKAVEDTALYRHHPLAALNEVGGDPVLPDDPLDHFHAAMARRAGTTRRGGLSPTTTHDAKRGAETRARLALLSELPAEWGEAVRRWRARNSLHRTGGLPDARIESLYYQTLVGAWPIDVERARDYMLKAAREAKQHTSWRAPDEAYERALRGFVEGTLADAGFVAELEELVRPLVDPGRRQCLALALLAAAAPGIPDIYRGSELWDRTLVDPDNRRPVDLELRRTLLAGLDGLDAAQVWARREEGAPMLYLWKRALDLRRRLPVALSAAGAYVPLPARGAHAHRVVAFARSATDGAAVAIAPRLALGLEGGWQGTALELPDGPWRDALSGAEHAGGATPLEELLAGFPVALLERVGGDA
jgi:(1->4)-alpha-D-glucan 1-alpha-D-glucosylmutase